MSSHALGRNTASYRYPCQRLWRARCNHRSASAKLFADAEAEERQGDERSPNPSKIDILLEKHENWDGDERVQDAVLRMLVDKYKPLRTGQIRTAEEKLKENLPQITTKPFPHDWPTNKDKTELRERPLGTTQVLSNTRHSVALSESNQSLPSEPVPPWLVTFKVPTHAQASIKFGSFASTPPRSITITTDPLLKSDPRARAQQRAEKRFAEGAGRVDRARESTLDYQSGIRGQEGRPSRPNPVSMRGWNALIEEKIQKAQATGMFDKIEGRGKPLQRVADEMNPFVAREEFLMNRIVRKNDAAPPWVELQKGVYAFCSVDDAEKATAQMRELFIKGWTRRMIRMLPLSYSAEMLENLTPESASKLQDDDWERQEEKFHDAAIRETNEVIRRYNTVAPYIVRRPLLNRRSELVRCYTEAGSLIVAGIQARIVEAKHVQTSGEDDSTVPGRSSAGKEWGLVKLLTNAVRQLSTRFSNVVARHMY